MSIADDVARWIQAELVVTQGPLAGQPFRLRKWQRQFLRGAFDPGVAEASLSLGRGGGKTTFVAAITSAALAGPLVERNAEVLVVAGRFDQTGYVYRYTLEFLAGRIESEPKRWRINNTVNTAIVEDRETGARLRCIGSDPKGMHGPAPAIQIGDEPAQWEPNKSAAAMAALRTSAGKIEGSKLFLIGTRPASDDHFFEQALRGGSDYCQVHAAPSDADPYSMAAWRAANPGLDSNSTLLKAIRSDARRAKRDPALLSTFRALRLNQGVADHSVAVLIDIETWKAAEGDAQPRGPYMLGVDLGAAASQSAFTGFWPESGALRSFAVFPRTPSLAERAIRDSAGRLYEQLAAEGDLLQLGNRSADVSAALEEVRRRWGDPVAICSDRFRQAELLDALDKANFAPCDVNWRGMGYVDGGEDVRDFRRAVADGYVTPPRSLLMRAGFAAAEVQTDPAGNSKIVKRKGRARDDVAVSLVLAIAEGYRRRRRQEARPRRRRLRSVVGR